MALCTIVINTGANIDNTQKRQYLHGTLSIQGSVYPAGGVPLDSVLLAFPGITTLSGVARCVCMSDLGSGYIYQRIPSTGTLMILQVPPNGSLTTAAPLQQIPSNTNMQGINADVINFEAQFIRNA